MQNKDLTKLLQNLDYNFKDSNLIHQALTHRSAGSKNYERLEFLGDSVLNFVIADELYKQFPQLPEGDLSRFRASLVKQDHLATIAQKINLGDFLYLGVGELKTAGFRRASILADTLEAVFAAIYLESGIEKAASIIKKLFSPYLKQDFLLTNTKDSKTLLQEFLQSHKMPLPIYKLVKTTGQEHEQVFYISCSVEGMSDNCEGQGMTRRKAEQEAAAKLLDILKNLIL